MNEIQDNAADQNSVNNDTEVTFDLKNNVNVKDIMNKKVPRMKLKINGVQTTILADTGSSINIIGEACIHKMIPNPHMQRQN